jgi:DNA invertase Pin-like site-specific DNA recombinase
MAYRRLEERRERQTATWTGRRPSSSQWSCGSFSEVNGGERPMLNVAYCRVSTEEQAAEGFSIDGQAEKLHAYAELHDLGPVMLIEDPGRSGKNLERPGLQQLLAMVEQGRVTNVLVWRLDRLSRNLSDLILLADTFGKNDVGLHSFTEKIDLSSATGRMFYNILGAFAQFYREQLAENVRLGMQQAAREGRWVNRPKMGYDLVGGHLVLNGEAPHGAASVRPTRRGAQLPGDRGADGREVLNGPGGSALQDLSWRSSPERRMVPRPSRAARHPAGVLRRPQGPPSWPSQEPPPALGEDSLRPVRQSGLGPATGETDLSCIAAGIGAVDAASPLARLPAWNVQLCLVCACWPGTKSFRRPSAASWPEYPARRREVRGADGAPSCSASWPTGAGSSWTSTTPGRSTPNFSPKEERITNEIEALREDQERAREEAIGGPKCRAASMTCSLCSES